MKSAKKFKMQIRNNKYELLEPLNDYSFVYFQNISSLIAIILFIITIQEKYKRVLFENNTIDNKGHKNKYSQNKVEILLHRQRTARATINLIRYISIEIHVASRSRSNICYCDAVSTKSKYVIEFAIIIA